MTENIQWELLCVLHNITVCTDNYKWARVKEKWYCCLSCRLQQGWRYSSVCFEGLYCLLFHYLAVQEFWSWRHSSVNALQHSIPVRMPCNTAFQCQCPATQHYNANALQHSIPVPMPCNTALQCQCPATQHSSANALQHSIIMPMPCNTALQCQCPATQHYNANALQHSTTSEKAQVHNNTAVRT